MKTIFEFDSYRKYLTHRFSQMPKKGHGQLKRLALALRVSPPFLSQVLSGKRGIRLEHALLVAKFLGLRRLETDYLLGLVQFEEAGSPALKEHFRGTLQSMKIESGDSEKPAKDRALTLQEQAQYYSNWYYSAAHVAVSIPSLRTFDALSERLEIEKPILRSVLDFLVQTGLCTRRGEHYEISVERTSIDRNSLMIDRHLLNWRAYGSEHVPKSKPKDLFFSLPMTIDAKAANEIRAILVEAIDRTHKLLEDASSEVLYCMNIDWFEV